MERSRGLDFGKGIDNERVVGTNLPVMSRVLLTIPPCAPTGTTCTHLGIFAGVDGSGVETIAFAESVRGYRAPPDDALCFSRPQCAGCL